jgi:hypothetical protein
MSFNRRGPDRRPDRERGDRPTRRPGGDWTPRDRPPDPSFRRDRPPIGRPRFDRPPDEGGMSIRLDPRRLGVLKRLAAEAGIRPGDLVVGWVEERIDASRGGETAPAASDLGRQLAALVARVEALESASSRAGGARAARADESAGRTGTPAAEAEPPSATVALEVRAEDAATEEPTPGPDATEASRMRIRRPGRSVAAKPAERVALHDEMIAVLRDRGPLTAAELAGAITERGRYAPPRSGKALDAAMVSQRVSNPTYRARFTRNEGRIGLADPG